MKAAQFSYPSRLRQRFEYFEQFADAIRGWDVDFRQLDCGRFQTEMVQIKTYKGKKGIHNHAG